MEKKSEKHIKHKKKLSGWGIAGIVIGSLLVVIVAAVLILGFGLLNRITRPETPTVFESDDEIVTETSVQSTPSPTPDTTDTVLPTATPAPTPTPNVPLPLSDVCEQTQLTDNQLALMQTDYSDLRYSHVLLIGVDRRGTTGNSRADTMMIATIDKVHSSLKLTTVMRDQLVDIDGVGYGKLNSSASKGGIELLMSTINKTYHINIKDYVLVDFKMFVKVVNKLGGVTVRMTAEEISATNDCIAGLNKQWGEDYLWDGFVFANPGNVKLNGKQALGYARVRHIDSDFSRTKRQFKILNAVFAKFKRADLARQYELMYEVMPLVETDMSSGEILALALSALQSQAEGLLYYQLPAEGLYQSGKYDRQSVLLCDLPANALALHEFMFRSDQIAEEAKVLSPGESLPPRTPNPDLLYATPTPELPLETPFSEPTVTPELPADPASDSSDPNSVGEG